MALLISTKLCLFCLLDCGGDGFVGIVLVMSVFALSVVSVIYNVCVFVLVSV